MKGILQTLVPRAPTPTVVSQIVSNDRTNHPYSRIEPEDSTDSTSVPVVPYTMARIHFDEFGRYLAAHLADCEFILLRFFT